MERSLARGFTLIELLVVIAIIGLLSSVIMTSLASARQKARDSERMRNLTSIRTALELYRSSVGTYPIAPSFSSHCSGFIGVTDWIPNLTPTYISELPIDPSTSGGNVYCYIYRSDATGRNYKLYDYNMPNTNVNSAFFLMDPARNYGLTRPDGCPSSTNPARTWALWSSDVSMCW